MLRSFHSQMLLLFFVLQGAFWWQTHKMTPEMSIIPTVMSEDALRSLSFGDDKLTHSIMSLQLSNAGDTFGRNTALYKYDLEMVKRWFLVLDTLDNRANVLPNLASTYYSQTQHKPDVIHMVEYLDAHSKGRPEKWWWATQAAYLALHKLDDNELAISIAEPLKSVDGIPIWARQLSAFVYEKQGEFGAALGIIETILEHAEEIPTSEMNFIDHFLKERIEKMEELSDSAQERLNEPRSIMEVAPKQ